MATDSNPNYREGHEYVVCPECGSHILLDSRENWLDPVWEDEDPAEWRPREAALNCDWEPCLADFDAIVYPPIPTETDYSTFKDE